MVGVALAIVAPATTTAQSQRLASDHVLYVLDVQDVVDRPRAGFRGADRRDRDKIEKARDDAFDHAVPFKTLMVWYWRGLVRSELPVEMLNRRLENPYFEQFFDPYFMDFKAADFDQLVMSELGDMLAYYAEALVRRSRPAVESGQTLSVVVRPPAGFRRSALDPAPYRDNPMSDRQLDAFFATTAWRNQLRRSGVALSQIVILLDEGEALAPVEIRAIVAGLVGFDGALPTVLLGRARCASDAQAWAVAALNRDDGSVPSGAALTPQEVPPCRTPATATPDVGQGQDQVPSQDGVVDAPQTQPPLTLDPGVSAPDAPQTVAGLPNDHSGQDAPPPPDTVDPVDPTDQDAPGAGAPPEPRQVSLAEIEPEAAGQTGSVSRIVIRHASAPDIQPLASVELEGPGVGGPVLRRLPEQPLGPETVTIDVAKLDGGVQRWEWPTRYGWHKDDLTYELLVDWRAPAASCNTLYEARFTVAGCMVPEAERGVFTVKMRPPACDSDAAGGGRTVLNIHEILRIRVAQGAQC